jgi:porin
VAITPWLSLSPNLQVINSGLNKALNKTGEVQVLDTTVEASLRLNVKF